MGQLVPSWAAQRLTGRPMIVWTHPVDAGHVPVVAGIGTRTGEGKFYKAGLFSFGGERIGQPLKGDGAGYGAASGLRRRTERPTAVGRLDLNFAGQLQQFFVDSVGQPAGQEGRGLGA